MKKISIIIPAYNEEESLPYLLNSLKNLMDSENNYEWEILFVNDGSKDNTLKMIQNARKQDNRICYINLSRNFGKEIAMKAGIDYITGDAAIFLDADLQDPPELIPKMCQLWEEGYDDVYAQRISRKGESFLKKFTSKCYYRLIQRLTNIEIQKDTGDFRLLDKRCVNALKSMNEFSRNTKSLFSWIGYKKISIKYERNPRIKGKTKWNYSKLFRLAFDGITSFTTSPLKISFKLSAIPFLALIIYAVYVMVQCITLQKHIETIQLLLMVVLLFSGIQMILIGIVGSYLGRVFNETKKRPLYFVDLYNDKKMTNE